MARSPIEPEVGTTPERAMKLMPTLPICERVGVQSSVPAVLEALVVNTAPAGRSVLCVPSATNSVIGSPSGSEAVAVTEMGRPATAFTVAGEVTIGG